MGRKHGQRNYAGAIANDGGAIRIEINRRGGRKSSFQGSIVPTIKYWNSASSSLITSSRRRPSPLLELKRVSQAMAPSQLADLSITEAASRLRRKEFSPSQLTGLA